MKIQLDVSNYQLAKYILWGWAGVIGLGLLFWLFKNPSSLGMFFLILGIPALVVFSVGWAIQTIVERKPDED